MAERTDLTTVWEESPRIVEVASPSTELVIQDLHDTLNSNTKQASHADDSLESLDDDPLIDSAGKEDLGGGIQVGITSTMLNSQIAFESRLTPTSSGTVTTANGAGTRLIDSAADFISDGVERGAVIINFADQSVTEVLRVVDLNTLDTRVLRAGIANDFGVGDVYKIWNIVQCNVSGGNSVAVDDVGSPISPIFPTAFTQVVRAASSAATALSQQDLLFAGAIWIDGDDGTLGATGSQQDPVLTIAEGLSIGATKKIKQFQLRGTLNFSSDPDPSEWDGYGGGAAVVIQPGANFSKTSWRDIQVIGAVSGDMGMTSGSVAVQFTRCGFNGSTYTDLHGFITDCAFNSTVLQPVAGAPLVMVDCASMTAGPIPGLTVDGSAGSVDISVRKYSGGLNVRNISTAGSVLTVGVVDGKITLEATCTAGTIVCRGTGTLVDNSAGATVVDEMLDPIDIQETHTVLGLEKGNKTTVTPTGIVSESGNIDINFTGDGVNQTVMDRQ